MRLPSGLRTAILGSTAAEARNLTREDVPAVMLRSSPSGKPVSNYGALEIADAFACIRALAESASSLPLVAYRRAAEGRVVVERGPSVELIERPRPGWTGADLIAQIVVHLNTWGNAFVGKYRDGSGRVVQLGCLDPGRMKVELVGGEPRYEYFSTLGKRFVLTTEDVIHCKFMSVDGLTGLSPVRQARIALGLGRDLTEYGAYFIANDAKPSGVLKLQKFDADEGDVEELRSKFNRENQGTKNAGKIAVLTGEMDFVPFSMPLEDAQFLDQRKLSAVETARIFQVPAWRINAATGESMTYANVEQEDLQFVKSGLRFSLNPIEQAFSTDPDLFTRVEDVQFLMDTLLRGDATTRANFYTAALNPITGWMTREEVRERENLPREAPQAAVPPVPTPAPVPDPTVP